MSTAPDTVTCPSCGETRIVTTRQSRRARAQGGIRCAGCRGGTPVHAHTDRDLRFWLATHQTPVPRETPVRDFIAAGGAPQELIELARSIFPNG